MKGLKSIIGIMLPIMLLPAFGRCASVSLQTAPTINFYCHRDLKGGETIASGQEFQVFFAAEKMSWRQEPLQPLQGLAAFQCDLEFDPEVFEPLDAAVGSMMPAQGWTVDLVWDKGKAADIARVILKGPKGDKTGLNGFGELCSVRFRTREDAGGPALLTARAEEYISEPDNFAYTGLAFDTKGEDMPIKKFAGYGPGGGLGSITFSVIPKEPRITAGNCQYQTIRLSLDRATATAYREWLDASWDWALYSFAGDGREWTELPIGEIVPVSQYDLVFRLADTGRARLAIGDRMRLVYSADVPPIGNRGRRKIEGETPAFLLALDKAPPAADAGSIAAATLTNKGKELPAYSSKQPPALEAKTSILNPFLAWTVVLYAPDGRRLAVRQCGPFGMPMEIAIDPGWPNGEYRLAITAFNTADFTLTSLSVASIKFKIQQ